MKKSLDEFLDLNHVTSLMSTFKESIDKIFKSDEERRKYKEICDNLLQSFREELEKKAKLKKVQWKINIIEPLKSIIDSLINLDKNNKRLNQLKEDFDSLIYFIYNYRKIRIPLLGGYSTGKSSFLNNMIGKDILPVDINKCTNRGIILRHNNNKNQPPQLFKTKFIKVTNPDYWYFKDEKEPFCEGYEEVKKKLIELNSQNDELKEEDAFIVLKVYLNIFSEIDFSKDMTLKKNIKDKLELIDFPGLDVFNKFYNTTIFSPLMRFSDGFIFMNECDLIQEFGNIKILTDIIAQIQSRKFIFTYKSCLFLLHKLDKSLNLDINKSKEIFEHLFRDPKKEKEELKVEKFSSKLYHIYIDFFNKFIIDFKSFLKVIFEKLVKAEEKKTIKNYSDFLNKINNISKKLKYQINKKLINNNEKKEKDLSSEEEIIKINNEIYDVFKTLKLEEINNEEKDEVSNNNKIIKEIYYNYLYLKKNHKIQNQRVLSNAKNLFNSLYNLLHDSYYYTEEEFERYLNLFINSFNHLFLLIDLKIYGTQFNQQIIFNDNEKKNNDLKEQINNFYNETINYVNNKLNEFNNKNQKLKDDFMAKYKDSEKKEFDELEKNIQNNINEFSQALEGQQKKLNEIIDKLKINNKIDKNLKMDFSTIILNKNSDITEYYKLYDNDGLTNFFKGISNFFISIHNWKNERKKIEKNIDDYLSEINDLIKNRINTYKEEIQSRKNALLTKIVNNLEINSTTFEGIEANRDEYEKIKKEYLNIICN